MSGSGGAEVEVCLGNEVSARQVGQVGRLAGTAERDCQAPPAGPIELLHAGSRKQVLLHHHYQETPPETVTVVIHYFIL